MQKDGLLTLADAQALTASAVSEHVVDQGAVMDMANGRQLFAVFTVTTTFTGAGTEALYFRVVYNSDDSLVLATAYACPLLGQSSLVALSSLTAGTQIVVALSPWVVNTGTGSEFTASTLARQYVHAAIYAVAVADGTTGDAFTAGAFDLHLTCENPRGQKYYPRSTLSDGNVVKFG